MINTPLKEFDLRPEVGQDSWEEQTSPEGLFC